MFQINDKQSGIAQHDILIKLHESKSFWNIKNELFQAINQTYKGQEAEKISPQEIHRISQGMGIEEQLKKLIGSFIQKKVKKEPIRNDRLDFLNQSRIKWSEILYKNFIVVFEKSKSEDEDQNKDSDLYIYDDKIFLNFLIGIKQQYMTQTGLQIPSNRLLHVNMKRKPLHELKDQFLSLRRTSNLGLPNDDSAQEKNLNKYKKARKIIESECIENEIENFAQEGIPHGERSELFLKYFEIEGKENYYQQLVKKLEMESNQSPNFLDDVLESDSQEILEDAKYFVFQEQIQKILKIMIRDQSLKEQLSIIYQQLDLPFENEYGLQIPMNGFLPCKNISSYIAPFCYLSTKLHIIYACFSQFYCRYICFLQSISSHSNSMLQLALLFEDIMMQTQGKLIQHLREIGYDALKLAFPMIQFIFIGYLDIEQIFYILDRIIGFQSLEVLPLAAAGLMKLKSSKLMAAQNQAEVDEILADLSEENAMELILTALNEI